jgi:aspartate ammonia-lyase
VQTLRAVENFPISGVALRDFSRFIDAFAFVKKAAALANAELGVLSEDKRHAIAQACDEITAGRLHDQFVVDMIQGGAGTATNMNVNEVIANRALEILGHERGQYAYLHPNDDVNCSQSTNDAYPTALKLGVFLASRDTLAAMAELRAALRAKGEQFAIIKMGRTQLQDADDARPGIHCLRDDGPSGAQPHRRCRTRAARRLTGCDGDRHRDNEPARLRAAGDQAPRRVQRRAGATGIRPGRGDPRLQRVR